MVNVEALHQFLREEFDAEARAAFPRLRRVPDTSVRHFLDYFESLNAKDQDNLADASTLCGTVNLSGSSAYQEVLKAHPAWASWTHELVMGSSRDPHFYYSVPLLGTCVAQAKMDRAKGKPSSVPKELEDYATSVRGAKAPDIRKQVRSVLESLLGARPSNLGGGEWNYEGELAGSHVVVSIDYGARSTQLGYDVAVESNERPAKLAGAGFERALGIGHGNWDFITEKNLSESIILLSEFVTYVAKLPQRLPIGCLGDHAA